MFRQKSILNFAKPAAEKPSISVKTIPERIETLTRKLHSHKTATPKSKNILANSTPSPANSLVLVTSGSSPEILTKKTTMDSRDFSSLCGLGGLGFTQVDQLTKTQVLKKSENVDLHDSDLDYELDFSAQECEHPTNQDEDFAPVKVKSRYFERQTQSKSATENPKVQVDEPLRNQESNHADNVVLEDVLLSDLTVTCPICFEFIDCSLIQEHASSCTMFVNSSSPPKQFQNTASIEPECNSNLLLNFQNNDSSLDDVPLSPLADFVDLNKLKIEGNLGHYVGYLNQFVDDPGDIVEPDYYENEPRSYKNSTTQNGKGRERNASNRQNGRGYSRGGRGRKNAKSSQRGSTTKSGKRGRKNTAVESEKSYNYYNDQPDFGEDGGVRWEGVGGVTY